VEARIELDWRIQNAEPTDFGISIYRFGAVAGVIATYIVAIVAVAMS